MIKQLLGLFGVHSRVEIPDDLWQGTIGAMPFLAARPAGDLARLRALAARLLADKQMSGAGGLELSSQMQVHIAAQACLPILNLGMSWYRGWTSIVVYPDEFVVPRSVTDEDGVVHEYDEPIVGEAWDGGPLLLAWSDARPDSAGRDQPYNVVIHEFTHKIDLLNGNANGVPPFTRATHPDLDLRGWTTALDDALNRFRAELELIESGLPAELDPDDDAAGAHYAHLPLDPYAAQDEGEFFAVSSEAFFVDPARLAIAFPEWSRQLVLFFKQDPVAAR